MKRKITAFVILLSLAMTLLSGCGGGENAVSSSEESTQTTLNTEEGLVVKEGDTVKIGHLEFDYI